MGRSFLDLPDGAPSGTASRAPNESITVTVLEAVSDATGTPAIELPPLGERLDTDVLDGFFDDPRTDGVLAFRYADHVVTVFDGGQVEVY